MEAEPDYGLNDAQVRTRIKLGYQNAEVESNSRSLKDIIVSNVFTYFNLIFFVLAAAIIAVGAWFNLTFMGVVIANIIIGIVQEWRSKKKLDSLNLLANPKANVMREGVMRTISVHDTVRDDIVELSAGDQIYADAVVVDGECLVNESLLTGEADELRKGKDDQLMSGSFLVSGQCMARLTAVGRDSYMSKLTLQAKQQKQQPQSEMMRSLSRLVMCIGIVIIPLGAMMAFKEIKVLQKPIQEGVVSTVASLVGMIPEGLYLLTSLALLAGVLRLAQRKTLVHEMGCIETLARVDTLCVDKTGTITEPKMIVKDLISLNEETDDEQELRSIMADYVYAMQNDNETMAALKRYFDGKITRKAIKALPFTSARKYGGVSFSKGETYLLGAPENIMGEFYGEYQEEIEQYSSLGCRVLLLAGYDGELDDGPIVGEITPLGLVLLTNKIRAEAPATFRYFREQGVAVKVISGDNPAAAAKVAGQAGIPGADAFVDAQTLKEEEELFRAAEKYTVFGRVTPEQKRLLVEALKKQGHTVAMTGDGVNDVLALKDADCGVAMASGSDAARHAAHLVLMDSDFSAMPQVVAEGRRVTNNIERAAALFLVKNIFSFLLTVILLFAPLTYPLTPIQLTMISGFTIGVPSFFLALEPNKNLIKGRFMNNVMAKAFPGGLTNVAVVLTVSISCAVFRYPVGVMNTMAGISVAFVGLLVLAQVCKPFNTKRFLIWLLMTAAMAVNILLLGPIYSLEPLRVSQWIVLGMIMGAAYPFFLLMKRLVPAVIRVWNRLSGRAERMHS